MEKEKQVAHLCAPINFFVHFTLKVKNRKKIEKKNRNWMWPIDTFQIGRWRVENLRIIRCVRSIGRLVDDLFRLFSRLQLWRGLVWLPSCELRFVNIIDADFCKHLKTHKTKSSRLPMRTKCVECLRYGCAAAVSIYIGYGLRCICTIWSYGIHYDSRTM